MNSFEVPKCALCEMQSNNLTSHITRVHKLSIKEYREQFPNVRYYRQTTQQDIIERNVLQEKRKVDRAIERANKNKKRHEEREAERKKDVGLPMLVCRLCGFESTLSLTTHVTRTHKMLTDTYREMFPGDVLQQSAPECVLKMIAALKERYAEPEHREELLAWRSYPSEVKHWMRKGFTEEESRMKISEFQSTQSLKLTHEKRSEMTTGDKNSMSLVWIARRNNVSISEAHELTPCFGRTGDRHPMFGTHHTPESLAKIASAPNLSHPDWRSKGEREVEEVCRTLIDDVLCNQQIGRWNVDIMIESKKLIIEFFGDYWHMNPRKYTEDRVHNLTKAVAKNLWERDARKIHDLQERGYEVIIVWEYDWRYTRDACVRIIKDVIDRTL